MTTVLALSACQPNQPASLLDGRAGVACRVADWLSGIRPMWFNLLDVKEPRLPALAEHNETNTPNDKLGVEFKYDIVFFPLLSQSPSQSVSFATILSDRLPFKTEASDIWALSVADPCAAPKRRIFPLPF